ncbi:hypothetical protein C2G38_2026937 [Gigaspora rosea]|uniref:Uncharacterized protein n=1 Tax=Gigaspora rosea TaxID=44941 RepID=A0A397W892_9GLOM|nr:hypothetical protein C2G38_2026937 [Gigaspora rosea]
MLKVDSGIKDVNSGEATRLRNTEAQKERTRCKFCCSKKKIWNYNKKQNNVACSLITNSISMKAVSSIHENNETTSPHPVTSSGHKNDISQEDDISLPIQRSSNIINFSDQIRTPYQENNLLQKRSAQFQQVDNEFEIALWVAGHKRILDLATNIRNGMMTRIDDRDKRQVTTSVSSMLYEPTLKPQKLTNVKEPYDKLDKFVINDVWKQLLQMHLKATDQTKLKKNSEIFTKLEIFVYQVIKTVLIAQDKHKDMQNVIRKCDEYTIDFEIPTKFEIVKSLLVRELLDC